MSPPDVAVHHGAADDESPDAVSVALFPTCLVDGLTPSVGVAAVRILRRSGCDVDVPSDATCCGQPAWNSGHAEEAARVARTTVQALAEHDADVVVVPAGSCATMIRVFWEELFEVVGDHETAVAAAAVAERTRELSEFLDVQGCTPVADGEDLGAVAYHHSCHMLRELRIEDAPEHLLSRAAGPPVELAREPACCGFGGLFSVKQPELSTAMADDVLDTVCAAGADTLVGCDASCLLHLAGRASKRELDLRVRHLAHVLDGSAPDPREVP